MHSNAVQLCSLFESLQMIVEISSADASAAAQIRMNNELSMLSPTSSLAESANVSGEESDKSGNRSDGSNDTDNDSDGDSAEQYEGTMTEAQIDGLSSKDRKKYYVSLNKLIAVGGADGYSFVDPEHVRCNKCAAENPKTANTLKSVGGGKHCEAILHLTRGRFDVSNITYTGITASGGRSKRQPGHHHKVHGCFKEAKLKSDEDKATAVQMADVANLRVWKAAYKPVSPNSKPELSNLTLPSIKLIQIFVHKANTAEKVNRGKKMVAQWGVEAAARIAKVESYVQKLPIEHQTAGAQKVQEMRQHMAALLDADTPEKLAAAPRLANPDKVKHQSLVQWFHRVQNQCITIMHHT